jgi:hypothetical protein
MVMNTDRRVILAQITLGRIRVMVCLAQLNVHTLMPTLMHFFNAQVSALAEAACKALSPITGPITDLMPLTRVEGLL